MRISSAGTVLVGKTAESTATDGIELNRNDVVVVTRNGDAPLLLNRRTSDGDLAVFRKDNTTVGSIGAYSGDVYIAEGDTGLRFNADNDLILPFNGSSGSLATRDAAIDLGTTGGRFKDLYLSGSVKVPAASKGIEYSSTAFITPENNVSGAEVSTPGVFVVKTGSTPAEAMRVDGSGNLLVGKTSASFTTAGLELRNGGPAIFGRSQAEPLILNRLTTDGGIVNFNKDGTTVGSIGVIHGNNLTIGSTTASHVGLQFGTGIIYPTDNTGSANDGAVALGDTNQRFSNLYLSGNVTSSGTFRGGAGSASTPTFLTDGSTGMYRASSNDIGFSCGGSERARIDSSGNLLVGKTALNIGTAGTEVRSNGQLIVTADADNPADFNRKTSDGTIALFRKDGVAVGSIQTNSGRLDIQGNANTVRIQSGTSLMQVTNGTQITFETAGSERMRIDDAGNLLVGTTSTYSTSKMTLEYSSNTNFGITLRDSGTATTAGHFNFVKGGSVVGTIQSTSSATSYNTSSDQRLKDNIVDAPSASDDIDAIQVRSFDWKADGSHQKYGMVAQELQSVAPEAVSQGETEEDMMGVDYSKLVPMLVKEIQSLRARVAQLEGEN